MAKTASKTRRKPASKKEVPRIPLTGEHVRRTGSDTEYEITYVAPDGSYVHLAFLHTNLEHRYIDVATLNYLEER